MSKDKGEVLTCTGCEGMRYNTIFFRLSTVLCNEIEAISKIVCLKLAVTFMKAFFNNLYKTACIELAIILL